MFTYEFKIFQLNLSKFCSATNLPQSIQRLVELFTFSYFETVLRTLKFLPWLTVFN